MIDAGRAPSTPEEQAAFDELVFELTPNKTLTAIGQRLGGLSRERVRQLQRGALEKLRRLLRDRAADPRRAWLFTEDWDPNPATPIRRAAPWALNPLTTE